MRVYETNRTDPVMRWPDGSTRLFGLIGERIAYTGSPAIHNRAAAMLGINAVYLPISLPAAQVAGFLAAAWHMGALGFNVTTPHKELVARCVAGCKLLSVNTLYRGQDGWAAASTDAPGFARGLQRLGFALEDFREVVCLGGGGATSALLSHIAALAAPPKLHVLRRDPRRDVALQEAVGPAASLTLHEFDVASLTRLLAGKGRETLLVQATNAPQHGDDLASFTPALAAYGGVVVDLVYAKPSALFHAAVARKLPAQDGEAMLIEQARGAQELWFGQAAPYDVLAAALTPSP